MDKTKKLIGVCGVRIYEQNVMPFMQILKKEGEKNGYHIISFSTTSDSLVETDEIIGQYQIIDLMRQVDICALIILTETIKNDKLLQRLVNFGNEKGIPVFSLDRKMENCYNLLMDNKIGFEQMVRHVVEIHGCKYVNMIAGPDGNRFSDERVDIYKKILQENGIPVEEQRIGYGDFSERLVGGIMKDFLENPLPFPEAIICANDIMAHTAISELNRKGFEVPEDVIVTGYDGTKNGTYFYPTLTTASPDYKDMVSQLYKKIAKYSVRKVIEPCDIVVPVLVRQRQSCGCEEKAVQKNYDTVSQLLDELGDSTWQLRTMQALFSYSIGKEKLEDIVEVLPTYMDIWFDYYRYVGVRSELFHSYDDTKENKDMTCMLEGNRGVYRKNDRGINVEEFGEYILQILEEESIHTVFIHLLSSGQDVYGFIVEGFEEMVDWKMKHCDEFCMFLSHILHAVTHNIQMKMLNENLREVNRGIKEMSLRDSMTGIYNRGGFFTKMNENLRKEENQGRYLYLFMVDMDGLKYINDNFSHAEGDFAITTLANVLTKMGKGKMLCSRVGGDEFICACVDDEPDRYNAEGFMELMERLIKETDGVSEKKYPISASVGMICERVTEHLDIDTMVNRADDKMYEHKVARKKKRE